MDKQQYLLELEKELRSLSRGEQQEILADYEEHFESARAKGRSDTDIIEGLGQPKKVAKEIIAQAKMVKTLEASSGNSMLRSVFSAVVLSFFNLIFILGPAIVCFVIPVVLYVCAVVLFIYPLLLLFQDGFTLIYANKIFVMLGSIGFGLLSFVGGASLMKLVYRLFVNYVKFNVRIVRGRSA
ncbi:DUF1700 domain-containing protein [Metabacillus fastidiosus]|uniref:DUF1700 domain-containing protein n=1 Tax=Metabacillus fastidiosus TaxID=1458 RepID=UPI002DBA8F0B|nr:DUF1700 domain-containing protein [Metabacillus fastidiosus]MEC2077556.1 DUF1700 domain-containing protein [Metabacillus fastidiosus]